VLFVGRLSNGVSHWPALRETIYPAHEPQTHVVSCPGDDAVKSLVLSLVVGAGIRRHLTPAHNVLVLGCFGSLSQTPTDPKFPSVGHTGIHRQQPSNNAVHKVCLVPLRIHHIAIQPPIHRSISSSISISRPSPLGHRLTIKDISSLARRFRFEPPILGQDWTQYLRHKRSARIRPASITQPTVKVIKSRRAE